MKKFNWNKILNVHTVIHCDTMEKAISLLAEADKRGLKWIGGSKYSEYTFWEEYGYDTCYNLKSGEYGKYNTYDKFYNYTILTYEDVLIKGENEMRPDTDDKEEILRLYDLGLNISTIKDKTGKSRGCIEYVINKYRRGENDMNRINKNYYKDGLRVTYEDDYIRIFKQFGTFILFDLFIGKDNLTFEQANEMLKPFGIIIEPKSTDWTKVEVGAELKVVIEHGNGMATGFKANFHSYLSATKQILVINGNKVEVYNEDEVELC